MYDIIPLALILISLSVIIIIILKKFPALASLDVGSVKAEREARIKEQIISNRLKENYYKWSSKIFRIFRPIFGLVNNFLKWTYNKLYELKDSYQEEKPLAEDELSHKVNLLFNEAEELIKKAELVEAEKKFIEIIGLDSKNIKAFKELAELYFEQKDFEEAKQTYKHILKLKDDDEEVYEGLANVAKAKGSFDEAKEDYLKLIDLNTRRSQTYFDLAGVYEATEETDEAISTLKKALKIEPNNPRYLDMMLKLSIIVKDRVLALDAFDKLRKVNSENQKLAEYKDQLDVL